ncbi:hypothetical protein VaNZ11_017007, partial [Volvox africanus]
MMACSPKRPDPLRDAEARVRALTREVGTLREDLRRETKKRERAVAQAKENEESRRASDARCQELAYSNRKLASELDTLHETARAAAERDRRALRGLREGLAAVEEAVAARARKGSVQIQVLHDVQQQLRQLLFGSTGGAGPITGDSLPTSCAGGSTAAGSILSGAAASRAQQLLATAQMHVEQLASLLTGGDDDDTSAGGSSGGVAAASFDGREGGAMALGLMLPGSRQGSRTGGGGVDLEKEQLQEEVMRLRTELRTQEDRSGPSSFTAMELQQSLREAQAELVRLRAEMVHLNAAAAAAAREQQVTAEALDEAHRRLQQQDELHAALVTSVREQEDSNQGLVTELTARRVELEGEVSNLSQRLGTLQQQVSELLEERQGMQELLRQREEDRRSLEELLQHREEELRAAKASILEQGADIRNALSLVSRPPGHGQAATYPLPTAAAAAPPTAIAPTAAELSAALSACLALPRSASAPPPTATAVVAPKLDSALGAALAPYHNASAAIGSALAAAAAIIPPTGMPQTQPSPPLGSSAGSTGAGSWLQPATAAAANGNSVLGHIQPSPQQQLTLSSAHLTPSQVLQQLQQQRSQTQPQSQYPHKKTLHQQQTAAPVRQQQALADLTALLGLGLPHRGRVVNSGTDSVAPSARGVYPPIVGGQALGNASGVIGTQRMLPPRAAAMRDGSSGGPGAPLGDAAWRQGARRMVGGEGLLLHGTQVSSDKA